MSKKDAVRWYKESYYLMPISILMGYILMKIAIYATEWTTVYADGGPSSYNIAPHRLLLLLIAFIMLGVIFVSIKKTLASKTPREKVVYLISMLLAFYVGFQSAYASVLIGAFTNF